MARARLLTSEACLLNPNRNPTLDRAEIEQRLRDYLGVTEILWLGDGIEGDDTDGHVDDLARFVSERTVVTVVEENRDDANYEPLQENLARLRAMKWNGAPFEVVTLPMPAKIVREDLRLPASYANFYIANECVLLPTFNDPNDAVAESTLAKLFPTRRDRADRLHGIDLGSRRVSLPDATTAGGLKKGAAFSVRRHCSTPNDRELQPRILIL